MSKWHSQKDGFQEALRYIKGRQIGSISSFKTPWKKINEATIDGIEWGSMTVIAGRPGTGKSLILSQLIREGIKLNCTVEQYNRAEYPFRVLEFQLEMIKRVSAIREFSSVLGKSYKYICSADGKITDNELTICYEYAKKRVSYPIDVIDTPCTISEFKSIIDQYMEQHSTMIDDKKIYKNTIVTIDHSLLLKKATTEKDKFDMLYNLGEMTTSLKRKYPIAFIILSQLNRNVESPERNEEGSYGNYILDSDIFGADALLQHAETVIGLNRPGQKKIRVYGPERFIIDNDSIIVFHFLKSRNADTRICFFQAEYDKMKIIEIAPPAQQGKKIRS